MFHQVPSPTSLSLYSSDIVQIMDLCQYEEKAKKSTHLKLQILFTVCLLRIYFFKLLVCIKELIFVTLLISLCYCEYVPSSAITNILLCYSWNFKSILQGLRTGYPSLPFWIMGWKYIIDRREVFWYIDLYGISGESKKKNIINRLTRFRERCRKGKCCRHFRWSLLEQPCYYKGIILLLLLLNNNRGKEGSHALRLDLCPWSSGPPQTLDTDNTGLDGDFPLLDKPWSLPFI
jgi:hypothetical protein